MTFGTIVLGSAPAWNPSVSVMVPEASPSAELALTAVTTVPPKFAIGDGGEQVTVTELTLAVGTLETSSSILARKVAAITLSVVTGMANANPAVGLLGAPATLAVSGTPSSGA